MRRDTNSYLRLDQWDFRGSKIGKNVYKLLFLRLFLSINMHMYTQGLRFPIVV